MKKIIFLGLLFCLNLFADNTLALDTNDTQVSTQNSHMPKVLYLSYDKTPDRVLKGEIFPVTIKTLSTIKNISNISYTMENESGIKIITRIPTRKKTAKFYYDTFYFIATDDKAKLPDFTASIDASINYKDTTLLGRELNVISLNPKKNFANIIANSFDLVEYKTTKYDDEHNIIVFIAKATNCEISALQLNGVQKQGIESITRSHTYSRITYYCVIKKEIENFSFSYFNLKKNKFITLTIPIIVNDDSVTTQTDLKPIDQSKEKIKMIIAGVIAFIGIVFIVWRKKYIYLIFIIIPLAYIAYIGIPSKEICIKKGSNIHLLPVHNGTIFETTKLQMHLTKEGNVKEFVKVQLKNEKIGWVRNEDLCSY